MTHRLTETTPLSEAGTDAAGTGRMIVQAISAGVGSSGYYSPQVLKEAANQQLIRKGTPLFLDHASDSERVDRPERSVRDIAAVFTEAARFENDALVGEVQVFAPYRELLKEMSPHIGLSISGSATDVTEGDIDGLRVPIIEGLHAIDSVDFVTRAGRGGKVLKLMESARADAFTEDTARLQLAEARNVGQWIESRLHLELTRIADDMFGEGRLTREERIALSSAVGDGLTAFTTALEDRAPALYTRDLWAEPEQMLATEESRRNVTATRPDSKKPSTEESKEDPMAEVTIEETELARLRDDAGRVQTAEQRAELAEAQLAERDRTDRARALVAERATAANVTFTPLEERGLLANLPTSEDGTLDEATFTTAVDEAATTVAESNGSGRVRGFGDTSFTTSGDGDQTVSEADIDQAVGSAFGRTVKEA